MGWQHDSGGAAMINVQIDIFLPISDANMNAYFEIYFSVD